MDKWEKRANDVRNAFIHAWNGYKKYAFGHDELQPLTNKVCISFYLNNSKSWGRMGATLVDALDTMIIMKLHDEVKLASQFIAQLNFDRHNTVSVFETTIRYLGGLLGAHSLTKSNLFLTKAIELGDRLIKAFKTDIPYHAVNLKTGQGSNPKWNGGCSLLAEIGSIQLEFKYLSFHTRNPIYAEKVKVNKVMEILDKLEKPKPGLYPLMIHPDTGEFCSDKISFGGMGDSFYEYLIKQHIQLNRNDSTFKRMYEESLSSMKKYLLKKSGKSGMLFVAEMENDQIGTRFEHLTSFIPGMIALGAQTKKGKAKEEDMELAKELMNTCIKLYTDQPSGIGPEAVNFHLDPNSKHDYTIIDSKYILRPETIESLFYLYRFTGDEKYRDYGWEIFKNLIKHCKTPSAFSSLEDVNSEKPKKKNSLQSFFFAETLKYLYLLFSKPDVIPLDKYVFNTEAHPLEIFPSSIKV